MLRRVWIVILIAVAVCGCEKKSDTKPEEPAGKLELVHPSTFTSLFGGICYLDGGGKMKCFDSQDHCIGAPPKGVFASISGTEQYACTLDPKGALACWGSEYPKPPIDRAVQVSVAKPHSCALGADGKVSCWGHDYHGSLGVPEGTFTQIAVGHSHTCALRPDKSAVCWGWNTSGQTKAPAGEFKFIAAGLQRSCGIRPDGTLVCWGSDTRVPPGVFTQVSVEGFRACALRIDAKVICWGYKWDGFTEVRGDPYTEVRGMCARADGGGEIVCFKPDGTHYFDDGKTRYEDANGACPPLHAPGPAPSGPAPRRPWIAEAMKLVRSHNWDALSSARDHVKKGDLRAFAEEYTKLTNWDDKMWLVYLVQDHHDPALTPMMKDFLSHPDCGDEQCWWSRAAALSHLDGNFNNFSKYLDKPDIAKKRTAELRKTFKSQ